MWSPPRLSRAEFTTPRRRILHRDRIGICTLPDVRVKATAPPTVTTLAAIGGAFYPRSPLPNPGTRGDDRSRLLKKNLPRRACPRRIELHRPRRRGHRPDRPQRRRQDDDAAHPLYRHAPGSGRRPHRRPGYGRRPPGRPAPHRRPRRHPGPVSPPDGARAHPLFRPPAWPRRQRPGKAHRRPPRPPRHGRVRRSPGQGVLQRPEPQGRPRPGPGSTSPPTSCSTSRPAASTSPRPAPSAN